MSSRWTRLRDLNGQRRRTEEARLAAIRARQRAALEAAAEAQERAERDLRELASELVREGIDAARLNLRQAWISSRHSVAAGNRRAAGELEPESAAARAKLLETRQEEERYEHLRQREAARRRGDFARRTALQRDEDALRIHVRRTKGKSR